MRPALSVLILAVALAGCTRFPELDRAPARVPANAPYPALVPLDPLLAEAEEPGRAETAGPALAARAARLRARASALSAASAQ